MQSSESYLVQCRRLVTVLDDLRSRASRSVLKMFVTALLADTSNYDNVTINISAMKAAKGAKKEVKIFFIKRTKLITVFVILQNRFFVHPHEYRG